MMQVTNDPINPDHYKQNGKEAIEILQEEMGYNEFVGYLKGNTFKYTFRAGQKGGRQDWINDVDKAIWYLNRLKIVLSS